MWPDREHSALGVGKSKDGRFILLDLVRATAILLLLVAHISEATGSPVGQFFGIPGFYYVSIGGVAVTIFLLLSGIVLELQYGAKDFRYLDFLLNRCLRIYPIYYMALLVGLSVHACSIYTQTGTIHSLLAPLGFSDLILSITGFYAFVGKWGGPFIGASWFVGLIIVMYMIYPLLSRAITKTPHVTIILLLVISMLYRLLLGRYGLFLYRPLDWFPLCRVFEFSLGIYVAHMLPLRIWTSLNSTKRSGSLIVFMSRISFPLFLVHHPLCAAIPYLVERGTPQSLAILAFLITSVLLSWLTVSAAQHVPRRRIFEGILQYLGLPAKSEGRGILAQPDCLGT